MGCLGGSCLLLFAEQADHSVRVASALMGVLLIGLALALIRRERRHWPPQSTDGLGDDDLEFGRSRYRRRVFGAGLMIGAALLVFLGGAIVPPEARVLFAATWLALLVFVVGMVGVALIDLVATRRYAFGQLRRLAAERTALLLAKQQAETELDSPGSEADSHGDPTESGC